MAVRIWFCAGQRWCASMRVLGCMRERLIHVVVLSGINKMLEGMCCRCVDVCARVRSVSRYGAIRWYQCRENLILRKSSLMCAHGDANKWMHTSVLHVVFSMADSKLMFWVCWECSVVRSLFWSICRYWAFWWQHFTRINLQILGNLVVVDYC